MELNHDHLTRQLDLIPVETLGQQVTIIGCGAIGSFLGLQLAKMGLTRITAYDHDYVSIENMSNQFFRFVDIGSPKTTALAHLISDFTDVDIMAYPEKYEAKDATKLAGIVVVAVDSMEARRMIYESIKAKGFAVKYIIDPRMSAEFYTQYTINPFDDKDQATYEKVLQPDSESVAERCTAKSTVYTASLAAGMVTKTIKNIMLKQDYPRITNWDISASSNPMVMYPGNAAAPQAEGATVIQYDQAPAPTAWRMITPELDTVID